MRTRFLALLAAAATLALGGIACSSTAETPAGTGAQAFADTGAAPAASPAAPRTDPLVALRKATNNLADATYRVVYDIEGSDRDTGGLDGTLTIASHGDRQAFGISGTLGNDSGTFLVINDGTAGYLCIEGQGDSGCLKVPAVGSTPIPLPSVMTIDDVLQRVIDSTELDVTEVAGRTIAGRDGRCFEVAASGGKGLVCVDEAEGLVLLIDGEFGGSTFRMTLRDYSDNPSDDEFEPPFPVIQLP